MFYILIIPILVYSLFIIVKLRNLKKHDIILYRFCQIRRDTMSLLRNKYLQLDSNEYKSLKKILEFLNHTIHYYDQNKSSLFNLRNYINFAKKYKESASKIEKIKLPENEEIKKIYKDFSIGMIYAFISYTPFIASEIFLRFVIYILTILTKSGIHFINKYTDIILEALRLLIKNSKDNNVTLRLVLSNR